MTMKNFTVELTGQVREVYTVQAETAEEAEENWFNGVLEISEAFDMGDAFATEDV